MSVPVNQFGKDHWSTFAYIETRLVDYKGVLNRDHMRCKSNRIAFHNAANAMVGAANYPTKLKGGVLLDDHDDWDCVDDLESAGFLRWEGTGVNPVFKLTELGQKVAQQLRAHKAEGKNFASFEFVP
jgi:hypothetical protein